MRTMEPLVKWIQLTVPGNCEDKVLQRILTYFMKYAQSM